MADTDCKVYKSKFRCMYCRILKFQGFFSNETALNKWGVGGTQQLGLLNTSVKCCIYSENVKHSCEIDTAKKTNQDDEFWQQFQLNQNFVSTVKGRRTQHRYQVCSLESLLSKSTHRPVQVLLHCVHEIQGDKALLSPSLDLGHSHLSYMICTSSPDGIFWAFFSWLQTSFT